MSIQVSNYDYEMDKWLASYFSCNSSMARIQVGSYIEILGLTPFFVRVVQCTDTRYLDT